MLIYLIGVVITLVLAVGLTYSVLKSRYKGELAVQESAAKSARDLYERLKRDFERQRRELMRERRLLQQEKQRVDALESKYHDELEKVRAKVKEYEGKLAELTSLDKEELKQRLTDEIERELEEYKAHRIEQIQKQLESEKQEIAQKLLIETMQNIDIDLIDEVTTSRIKIDNPELKGKIIGKEGRNIRAFEKAAKVDIAVDEEDDYITISSYDPVRREVARLALEFLMKDGRIHPAFIEQAVKGANRQLTKHLIEEGKKLAAMAGVYKAPNELYALLGRMKFRRSNGQNLYTHTAEVIKLSEELARELNADVRAVKMGALLHDVGKLLTAKIKKPHHHISADIARKYGFDEKVVNIVAAHHGDIPSRYLECEILKIADKISGLRPGARKDTALEYVDRIKSLEQKALEIAKDRAEEIYALKAGRELRIIVKPTKVNDEEAALLAYDIAKGIEESGVFPGEVEVVVIREVRSYAKAGKPVRK